MAVGVCACMRACVRAWDWEDDKSWHRHVSIFMCLSSLTVAIDNIHFLTLVKLLHVSLKHVCNISENKFALQIRKNIHIFLDVYFLGRPPISLHAVPLTNKLLATFQDNTDNNFAAIHHKNDLILTYYWQRCIITEKNSLAFKYYWQVGYIPDKSDEMRVGLLTEFFCGRQVCCTLKGRPILYLLFNFELWQSPVPTFLLLNCSYFTLLFDGAILYNNVGFPSTVQSPFERCMDFPGGWGEGVTWPQQDMFAPPLLLRKTYKK